MSVHLVVCPGFHAPELTRHFLEAVRAVALHHNAAVAAWLTDINVTIAEEGHPPYLGLSVDWLRDRIEADHPPPALLLIGFSAGVVGAIQTAVAWQLHQHPVRALIAVDGWGVPLTGDFPIHRVSHDAWTHWSSVALGGNATHFYAEPAVNHLDLWRSPQTAIGWQISPNAAYRSQTTAAQLLVDLIALYIHNQPER
ncbi:MAG TPA: hypothetical protein IGS53_24655 [Leptolyngbyaceae cyanobacterium M33_DOE_097]|uniref:Alpha/beta hydrolase n=1 Tax=Oscillatoriales cyanobacterium SpSt-418 TaxID=2282169 RepID=A0A7C3PQR6_9CYAN|nr:hypothetical protein [Leptolyngbyaceae cyanobacterium M33_DOE_097]